MPKPSAKETARKSKKPAPIKKAVAKWLKFSIAVVPLAIPIQINIEAAAAQGKGWTAAVVGIGFVLFAATCAEYAFRTARERRWVEGLFWIALCISFVALNAMNAIGNLSAHSVQSRDANQAKIQAATYISDQRAELENRRKEHAKLAGEAAPESIESEIRADRADNAKLWQSSFKCDPSWITRSDTRAFCKRLSDLEAKKASAEKRDQLDTELVRLADKAEAQGAVPSTVDSFADSMTAALKKLGYSVDQIAVVQFRDWAFAIGIEVMGTFAPVVLIGLFFHGNTPAPRSVSRSSARLALPRSWKPSCVPPATAPVFEEPGDIEEWFGQCVRVVYGKSVRSGFAHKAYVQWCKNEGKTALNLSRFGEAMRDVIIPGNPGVGKLVRHKDHFYTGLELVTPVSAPVAPHAWTPRLVGSTT